MHRLIVIVFIVLLSFSGGAKSVGDDPMQAVTEQAAVLDAAPSLDNPNNLDVGVSFSGQLLKGDRDRLVFIPLPRGEGQAALICINDSERNTGLRRLYHWSGASKVADLRLGIAIFSYGPELGGAVRFGMDGTGWKISYHCTMCFPPIDSPPPFIPIPLNDAESSPDGELTISLAPGETRRATINTEGPEPRFTLDLEEGNMAFVVCRDGQGATLTPDTRVWSIAGATKPTSILLGDLSPIFAETEPAILLSRTYTSRLAEGAIPLDVDCTLHGVEDLPRPEDMGPPAEIRVFETMASGAQDDVAELANTAKPSPPGLEALNMRETPGFIVQPMGIVVDLCAPNPHLLGVRLSWHRRLKPDNRRRWSTTEKPA